MAQKQTPRHLPLQFLLISGMFFFPLSAIAQRIPVADDTLGNERSIVSPDEVIRDLPSNRIDGGARRGGNLFHSFREFDVDSGRGAYFSNLDGIKNILARVTGNNRSNILGTLGILGNANLFLINPNGVVFGSDARLDVAGSFISSTADSFIFENGFAFSATDPQAPPLLTVSAPVGLQYGSNPGAIQTQRATLEVSSGETLVLAGGMVHVKGGDLLAPGGRVELASIADAGEVELAQQGQEWQLRLAKESLRTDMVIENDAIVDVSSDQGGSIAITADNLTIAGAETYVIAGIAEDSGTASTQAGDIAINTTAALSMDASLVSNEVQQGGTGNAGNIRITTGEFFLTNGGSVNASTEGRGNAGSILIMAREILSFNGVGSDGFASGVVSIVGSDAIGQGGNINIATGRLLLSNGAEISAGTYGQGNAGNITITARETLSFDGVGSSGYPSAVGSIVGSAAIGRGGDINITADNLLLSNGGQVDASTYGRGDAGDITITARDTLSSDGVRNDLSSGLFSAVESSAVGQGGRISVKTGRFSIRNGAELSAASEGEGSAGQLSINARQLHLDQGSILTKTDSGRGGDTTLQIQDGLLLRNQSRISTTAGTAQAGGNGGNIAFTGDFIAAVDDEDSDIGANAFTGRGGRVEITTQGIFGIQARSQPTLQSDITASSQQGVAGVVTINTPDVDPSRGLIQLPVDLTDASQLIAQTCPTGEDTAQNQFVVTGRGGLPPTSSEAVSRDAVQVDLVTVNETTSEAELTVSHNQLSSSATPLVEAQGWQMAGDGTVTLVATSAKTAVAPLPSRLVHCR